MPLAATLVLLPALLLAHPASACSGCAAPAAAAAAEATAAPPAAEAVPPRSFAEKPAVGTRATCPVMGEAFTVTEATKIAEYQGRFYAFCCPGCDAKFKAHPEKYADPTT